MCSLGSPEIGWATTRNAKHVESCNTQPKNEWMNEKCFVIIIVVCYSPLPFSGNVVRACKIISRLASRTHLHIKTAFVCVAFPRKPRKQKVRVIFNWTKKVKPNRSLGIKFLCVSQFDFAVVASSGFLFKFSSSLHYHGNDSPDSARPPRWPCNQSGMQTQHWAACVYHNHVNNNALDSLTKSLSR